MTNSSQTVTGTLTMDGFGCFVASTGSSSNPYMFAATSGYRNDGDAGLSHVGARYYDAQVGRFITRDTYLDQKPYLYCEHDPVNNLDPSGHTIVDVVKGGWGHFGVAAVIARIVENETPKGTIIHKIAGFVGVASIFTTGVGLVCVGAPTSEAGIGIAPVIIGVGLILYSIKKAHMLMTNES